MAQVLRRAHIHGDCPDRAQLVDLVKVRYASKIPYPLHFEIDLKRILDDVVFSLQLRRYRVIFEPD